MQSTLIWLLSWLLALDPSFLGFSVETLSWLDKEASNSENQTKIKLQ